MQQQQQQQQPSRRSSVPLGSPRSAFLTSLYRTRRRARIGNDELLKDRKQSHRVTQEVESRSEPFLHRLDPVRKHAGSAERRESMADAPASPAPCSLTADPGSPTSLDSAMQDSLLPKLKLSDLQESPRASDKALADGEISVGSISRESSGTADSKPMLPQRAYAVEPSAEVPHDSTNSDRERVKSLALALRQSNENLKDCQDELRKSLLSLEEFELRFAAQFQDLELRKCTIERESAEQCRQLQLENNRLRKRVDILTGGSSVNERRHQDTRAISLTSSLSSLSSRTSDPPSLATKRALGDVFRNTALEEDSSKANIHILISACSKHPDIRPALCQGSLQCLFSKLLGACDGDIIDISTFEEQVTTCLSRKKKCKLLSTDSRIIISRLRTQVANVRQSCDLARIDIEHSYHSFMKEVTRCADVASRLSKAQPQAIASLQKKLSDHRFRVDAAEALLRKESNWRRLLHNQLMEMKGNIRVVCHIRPSFTTRQEESSSAVSSSAVTLLADSQSPSLLTLVNPRSGKQTVHEFDFVLPASASGEEVFQPARELIVSVLDGFNVQIFAYGQTGSGKSHTMTGPSGQLGVTHLALKTLFELMDQRAHSHTYSVSLSIFELYNKEMFDLLADPTASERCPLLLARAADGTVTVKGAMEIDVSSWKAMQQGLKRGLRRRQPQRGLRAARDRSDRSHCITRVHITGRHRATSRAYSARLHLVDLAASDALACSTTTTTTTTGSGGGAHIQQSLAALGSCLYALAAKRSHVPYHDAKLTYLLSDSLGGDSKTLVYTCLSPDADDFSHTLASLRFAGRVRHIRQTPVSHVREDTAMTRSTSS